jgi:drug/metabolite transporter (DMT)-like permease
MSQPRLRERRGLTSVVIAALLWGFSGIAAQQLFERYAIQPTWLAAVRVLGAGVLLGLWSFRRERVAALRRFVTDRAQLVLLVVFAVVALDGVQLTFFLAIAHGSAVSATLLQFTSPLMILAWVSLRRLRLPHHLEALCVLAALVGVALVVTGGSLHSLQVPVAGIVLGLLSAVLTALYNLLPARLLASHSADAVVAAAFLIGSLALAPWLVADFPATFTRAEVLLILFVVVGGTAVPFLLYLGALATVAPLLANVVGTLEPLTAAIVSVFVFALQPTAWLAAGITLVLGSVIGISVLAASRTSALPHAKASAPPGSASPNGASSP